MGFEQYHEPASELSNETRTFVRMTVSFTKEAGAINWYEQRISIECACHPAERAEGRLQTFRHGSGMAFAREAAVA
jgi:hypothetical protein